MVLSLILLILVIVDRFIIAALNAYHSGDPDYQPAMSQEEVLKELGL